MHYYPMCRWCTLYVYEQIIIFRNVKWKYFNILWICHECFYVYDKNNIIQEFITGDEYTVDIISDNNGNIISIIPKKRLLIKNGQAFKSIIINNDDVISFIRDVCLKLNNKSSINIQVIQEKDTGKIYLIEINPRFGTTMEWDTAAGHAILDASGGCVIDLTTMEELV